MLAQNGHCGLHRRQSVTEQPAPLVRVLRLVRERLQDLLLALRGEARKRAQLLMLRGELQVREGRDPELLPDARRRLRPEPRQPHEEDDLGWDRALPLRQRFDLALLDYLDDLLLDRLADPLQLLGSPVERELRDRAGGVAHARGRTPVRDHPERLGALELQQVGEKLELLRDLRILRQRRHCADHMLASAALSRSSDGRA